MKSFCIKTNNTKIVRYLIEEFSKFKKNSIIVKSKSFKIYENVIVHYLDSNVNIFNDIISIILTNTIIKYYEPIKVENELNSNFFYFSKEEKKQIMDIYMQSNLTDIEITKYNELYSSFFNYIEDHHSILLTGFYNFRLSKYNRILSNIIDECISSFLLEREYIEFTNILKLYINSNSPKTSLIHLIYLDNKFVLLDNQKNIIQIENQNSLNAKFLSDITFSDNDYILNYLLNALPQKIIIHTPFNIMKKNEFLSTLELIFGDRIKNCTQCNICSVYKYFHIDNQ